MNNFIKYFFKILFKNQLFKYIVNNIINLSYILRYKNLSLEPSCRIRNCRLGFCNRIAANVSMSNVDLGDFSYIAQGSQIQNTQIGRFCSIGPGTRIGLGSHPIRDIVSTHPFFYSAPYANHSASFDEFSDIKIGHDVWIGADVIILDNVEIANGAIIGAGSFVNKNVGPYEIVAGIPARPIRRRFDLSTIETLEQMDVYSWPLEKIVKFRSKFGDIATFLNGVCDDEC